MKVASSCRNAVVTAATFFIISGNGSSSLGIVEAIPCPAPGDEPTVVTGGSAVTFERSTTNQVCLLQRITTTTNPDDGTTKKFFSPAGRSYDGRDWESVAGPYTTEITFTCDGAECSTTLPSLDESPGDQFILVTKEHTVSDKEEVARFLEQATFGPTRDLLDNWNFEESFDKWVETQISSTPATEHRQYFRKRANARSTRLKDDKTALSDKACDVNSRWRNYAFGWEEYEYKNTLTFENTPDPDTYLLLIDGVPRTEAPKEPYSRHGLVPGVDYRVVGRSGEYVGGKHWVLKGSSWKGIDAGNPAISFVHTQPNKKVNLGAVTVLDSRESEVLSTEDLSAQAACADLPSEGGVAVHGQTSDGTWYMHDPRIVLKKNTLEDVLEDGGGSAMSNGITHCSNAPRTFLNEDTCKVSPNGINDACAGQFDIVNGTNVIVCGSPGEIPNDPTMASEFDMGLDNGEDRTGYEFDFEVQRETIWTLAALYAPDQLRQRVAWALSQIIPIAIHDIDAEDETEPFVGYHDIFVRNAFGNYKNILKEVAHSPLMAEMLTFRRNKSMKYALDREYTENVFPDENFAREILQLFCVGLNQMNLDGTPILDENGDNPLTYDNDDIMDGARVWTGLDRQPSRANIEDLRNSQNRVDPMQYISEWHDPYPKMALGGKSYIGDGIPLCMDAPDHAFLKVGAKYRFLGSKPLSELQEDGDWVTHENATRVVLKSSTSALYGELCNNGGSGSCDLSRMEVTLTTNLDCDDSEGSIECIIDQPRVVELEGQNLFYEYVKAPCAQFLFYNDGKKIKGRDRVTKLTMCGDPRVAVAADTCCNAGKDYNWYSHRACAYTGERVTYATNEARCAERGYQMCTWETPGYIRSDGAFRGDCGPNDTCCLYRPNDVYWWTPHPCTIYAKINPEDGRVAVVHNHTDWNNYWNHVQGEIADSLKPSNINYFRVFWKNGEYPADEASCGGSCYWDVDNNACICEVTVDENGIFEGNEPPFYYDALEQLMLESPDPRGRNCVEMDATTTDVEGNTVIVWDCTVNRLDLLHADTVFELQKAGSTTKTFLKNSGSKVIIDAGGATEYSFRNPPHLVGLAEQDTRDVQYEIDLVLDDMFYNSNTAPFLAKRLIQRFGHANPSPNYVEAVATAFQAGVYQSTPDEPMFGVGDYGDLAATIAAILLHPEARSPVLDADPSFGSLREPAIKLIHLMRAMEFEPLIKEDFKLIKPALKIKQYAWAISHVFSFFLPDFVPPGRINEAGLVSPEAGMMNTPAVLGLLEGMFSLIKYGLSECYGGFGDDTDGSCSDWPEELTEESPKALGRLIYQPAEGVNMFDDLSLLLTAGRLSDGILKHYIYELGLGREYDTGSLRVAQQLIVSSPEFHANALVERKREVRAPKPPPTLTGQAYRNVVYFFFAGGADTYNMIVPDPTACPDLYANYTMARGEAALTLSELGPVVSTGTSQTGCNSFRFHKSFSYLPQLFNTDKEAAVLTNTGVLFGPTTPENYREVHAGTNLFAHDVQQRETKLVDPFQDVAGTGVLGRMNDVLRRSASSPFNTAQVSVEGDGEVVAGSGDGFTHFVNYKGTTQFDPEPSVARLHRAIMEDVNNATFYDSSLHGELWSTRCVQALDENEDFYTTMNDITLNLGNFATQSSTAEKFAQIAKMIKAREARGVDRDVFYTVKGGWDTHDDMKSRLSSLFSDVDSSLEDFIKELKDQTMWDNTVIVVASDFARTLSMNSRDGTDHAWAGQYLVMGGDVKGGIMHGTYPGNNFEAVDVGRGRLHPTTPWEAPWKAIAEWSGVPPDQMSYVLPNVDAFDASTLFSASDMFKSSDGGAPVMTEGFVGGGGEEEEPLPPPPKPQATGEKKRRNIRA